MAKCRGARWPRRKKTERAENTGGDACATRLCRAEAESLPHEPLPDIPEAHVVGLLAGLDLDLAVVLDSGPRPGRRGRWIWARPSEPSPETLTIQVPSLRGR